MDDLEYCIRAALETGELSPAAQKRLEQRVAAGNLTHRDRQLLSLLNDAIDEGCIHCAAPVALPKSR